MEPITIEVEKRGNAEKASSVLTNGMLPIELYGPGVKENLSFKTDYQDFRRSFRKSGYNKIVELVDGKDKNLGLIHHIQFHPATDQLMHVDVLAVDPKVPVVVKVPLTFSGNSVVVRDMGGVLKYNAKEVKIKVLVKDLIEEINVDISTLKTFGASVRIKNLVVPEGVEVVTKDKNTLVVSANAPRGADYRDDEDQEEGETGEKPAEGTEENAAA